jgi:peptidoglycan/xylan/chitin deacetylase (PgdA/CDA1 family)
LRDGGGISMHRDRRHGALALTFDNLGEASELERGTWPAGAPVGRHRSVTEALPRLLDELDALGLSATFFVEAVNCEIYPDAVRQIAAHGHELGMHGWRHEQWAGQPAARERSLLQRGRRAFDSLGLSVSGFRPPGGELNPQTPALLQEAGFQWCSPEGRVFRVDDGFAYVPFSWELVDAYYLMEDFAQLRVGRGEAREPLDPDLVKQRMLAGAMAAAPSAGLSAAAPSAGLSAGARGAGAATTILHPFLLLYPGWWRGTQALLAGIAARVRDQDLWVGPGGALAGDLRALR